MGELAEELSALLGLLGGPSLTRRGLCAWVRVPLGAGVVYTAQVSRLTPLTA